MEVIDEIKVESPLPPVKLEPASPEHSLEESVPEEPFTSVKSEKHLENANDDLVCQEEKRLSHIKEEVIVNFKDEIEIGPIVIQARVASTVEASTSAGTSEAEYVESCGRGAQQNQFSFIDCNRDKMVYGNLSEVASPLNQLPILHNHPSTKDTPHATKLQKKSIFTTDIQTNTVKKQFTCNFNYKTGHKAALIRHAHTHTDDTMFSCDLCHYKTNQKSNLIRHIRTHTGEKPFSCHLCNYKASIKSRLTDHIRTHTGDKPFFCNLCNYKATTKFRLSNHIRTHTGDKPFTCNLCNYKACTKSGLSHHISTHADYADLLQFL